MKSGDKCELRCWQPYCTSKNVPGKIKFYISLVSGGGIALDGWSKLTAGPHRLKSWLNIVILFFLLLLCL